MKISYSTAPTKNGLSIEVQALRDALDLINTQKHYWGVEQKAKHGELVRLNEQWSHK